VASGDDVRVCCGFQPNRAISDLSLEYVKGDLRDAALLARALKGVEARHFHVPPITLVGHNTQQRYL